MAEDWFPATGYKHTGGPAIEVYTAGDYRSDDYKCEVWIPIRIKSNDIINGD
ncbi:GyrI-like domain-containing protein [Paenibacillus cellulosilyticus]|nr:GyrI-like domain-containing protein [Paenibacillus cellulosilyticus]QKS46593.1 GyrI-like domain-containing protein [Paenibacillus cellulosilyticus]